MTSDSRPSELSASKTCVVTGATDGIGLVTARELARVGWQVTIVGRSKAKCQAAVVGIMEETQNLSVNYMLADLASQEDVRRLADSVKERHQRLDVLVNNAGAVNFFRDRTVDGIESTFAVNHLAYFMLTHLLLDLLRASAPARIVNVASDSHRQVRTIDLEDLADPHHYVGHRAYARSKLCNVLFTYELARRLEGSGVAVNALHPGLVKTNIMANNGLLGRICKFVLGARGISTERGAATSIHLASSGEVEDSTGLYFVRKQPVRSSKFSYDEVAATRLWELSMRLTGISAAC